METTSCGGTPPALDYVARHGSGDPLPNQVALLDAAGQPTGVSSYAYGAGHSGTGVDEMSTLVRNKRNEPVPTPIAIIGLPGGFEPNHQKLKELVKQKTIAAYEVIGRDVVLYWRSLGPAEVKRVPVSFVAAIPARYQAPASRAYLHYGDEDKTFIPGVEVEITPK